MPTGSDSLPGRGGACRVVRIALFYASLSMVAVAQATPDDDSITELIGTRLACDLIGRTRADMPVEPVYRQSGTACEAVVPRGSDDIVDGAGLFSDARCSIPLNFETTSLQSWCTQANDRQTLGNGDGIGSDPVWTLTPGNRIDVGSRSLEGVLQPYLQRRIYRTVETARGRCDLEMRIYARHPAVSNQRSMLALHGGSWSSRSFGTFGLEFTVPHFVDQGFVVYAPYYRLLGEEDSSPACNGSDITSISDDASAALDWVEANAALYGSSGKPVVFGQSAGAQLAASLAVGRSASVAGAVLYYPPVDFEDFVLRAKAGLYTDAQGLGILETLLGTTVDLADVSASPVPENSFPEQVAGNPLGVPPVFLMHGSADTLVEDRQSVRLCQALAGRPLTASDQPVDPVSALREIESCASEALDATGISATAPVTPPVSRLHRIREGQHALDLCLVGTLVPVDTCRAGSEASRELVSDSVGQSVAFAAQAAAAADTVSALPESPADDDADVQPSGGDADSGSGGGGGGYGVLLLSGLLGAARVARHRFRRAPPARRAI